MRNTIVGKSQRLNLRLSQSLIDRLTRIAEDSGASSISEVIRNAIALYELVHEKRSEGWKIVAQNDSGDSHEVWIIPDPKAPGEHECNP